MQYFNTAIFRGSYFNICRIVAILCQAMCKYKIDQKGNNKQI